MLLKRLHFYGGILFLILFILSGQYMQHVHNRLQDLGGMERMIFRAEHIYLLFCSLIHIGIGTYFQIYSRSLFKYLQIFSSSIMFLATFLFYYSFFMEMPSSNIERAFSRTGLYLMLGGVSLHGLISLIQVRFKKNP